MSLIRDTVVTQGVFMKMHCSDSCRGAASGGAAAGMVSLTLRSCAASRRMSIDLLGSAMAVISVAASIAFAADQRIELVNKDVAGWVSTNEIAKPNTLSKSEAGEGWKMLWDGKTTEGWRSATANDFPKHGWQIKAGELTVLAAGGKETVRGGDIITCEKYSDFVLKADFKITPGANSGIKYFINPDANKGASLEYQILDDERHPDAKLGRDGNRTIGSLYDLIAADKDKKPAPIGEWNHAVIICSGTHVEHWMNGRKMLEYERGSADFRKLVAESKYKSWVNFGEAASGHILLQDHGNQVSFRNIKIKILK